MKKNISSIIAAAPLLALSAVLLSPYAAQAQEVAKGAWTDHMKTALPAALCDAKQFFRQCYNVTATECEETAASATRLCLQKNEDKIPATLNLPEDGKKWGAEIGRCAGNTYDVVLTKKKINSKRCNDAENWTPK